MFSSLSNKSQADLPGDDNPSGKLGFPSTGDQDNTDTLIGIYRDNCSIEIPVFMVC